jgi:hypothetical protein
MAKGFRPSGKELEERGRVPETGRLARSEVGRKIS